MSRGLRERAGEILLAPFVALALLVLRTARRRGVQTTPLLRRLYDRVGVYPVIDHYYEPMIAPARHLRKPLTDPRPLPGVDLAVDRQLELLASLGHGDELLAIPRMDPGGLGPYYDNDNYVAGDAELLYALVRHVRPSRIVEVGGGMSTRFVVAANRRNVEDGAPAPAHVCIEPYEMPWLEQLPVEVVRARVEDVDSEVFDQLVAGDILFIDSSHVIRPQGDVLAEYLRILPRLASGVYVHIHDIFTPRDYPRSWLVDKRLLWNEQYLLEALLTDTDQWDVVLAANHLSLEHPEQFAAACPVFGQVGGMPGSFWIRRR